MKIIKQKIIHHLPSSIVNRLRLIKILKEKFYYLAYIVGFSRYYPIYLKVRSSKNIIEKYKMSTPEERWGSAFHLYNSTKSDYAVDLVWSESPMPGNFGDWLSPYIISKLSSVDIRHLNEVGSKNKKHILALGSIMSCANEFSIILGSGVTNCRVKINPNSYFVSVRGKYTAKLILDQSENVVNSYGDIGFLLSQVYTPKTKGIIKNKYLLVRHIQHLNVDIEKNELINEYSIFAAHPVDIELFIDELQCYEKVITSAMHCFIACIAYGIPCLLVTFDNISQRVPGDGVKYLDSLSGVGLSEVSPLKISSDGKVRLIDFLDKSTFYEDLVNVSVLKEISRATLKAIDLAKYKRKNK